MGVSNKESYIEYKEYLAYHNTHVTGRLAPNTTGHLFRLGCVR